MAGYPLPNLESRPTGRPSKFTPETRGKLLQSIRLGNHLTTACQWAGITVQTFRNWMLRGERIALMEAYDGLDDLDLDFLAFYEAVSEAQATAEMTAVAHWRNQMPTDWKASRDFLARRFPEKWGAKVEVNISHTDEQILSLLTEIQDEEKKKAIEAGSMLALARCEDDDGDPDE